MTRFAFLGLALLVACGTTSDGARAVFERTKTTTATYASYQWMIQRDQSGGNHDGWAAEFHRGDWHRIENQWRRVVANCRTRIGYVYEVATGSTQRLGTDGICGIDDTVPIASLVRLPSISSSAYGALDVIRVTDERRVRTYQVDRRGALAWVNWSPRDGSRFPCLTQESIAIATVLPRGDVFSAGSLQSAATPALYQHKPKRFAVSELPGVHCD